MKIKNKGETQLENAQVKAEKSTQDAMTSTHLDALTSSPDGEALALRSELSLLIHTDGWAKDHLQERFRSPGQSLTLAFYHFSQGATIVAILIVVYADWIKGRMKDRLLVRKWQQMPQTCDVRHRRYTSI
jgi:hypothetical protein